MSLVVDLNKYILTYIKSNDVVSLALLMLTNTEFFTNSDGTQKEILLRSITLTQPNVTLSLSAACVHVLLHPTPDYNSIVEILHSASSSQLYLTEKLQPIFKEILKGMVVAIDTKALTESNVLVLLTPILLFLSCDVESLHASATKVLISSWKNYSTLVEQIVQDICLAFSTSTAQRSKSVALKLATPLTAALVLALQADGEYKKSTTLATTFMNNFFATLISSAQPSLLANFSADVMSLATTPAYPAALILFQLLVNATLTQLVKGKLPLSVKYVAIDFISQVAASFHSKQTKTDDKMQEVCNSCGNDFVQTEGVEWTNVPQGMCGKCYVNELLSDYFSKLTGKKLTSIWYLREAVLALAANLNVSGYKLLCGLFLEQIKNDEKSKEWEKNALETQLGWEDPQNHFIVSRVNIGEVLIRFDAFDDKQFLEIVIPEFPKIQEMCLNCTLKMIQDSQAMVRARGLKGLVSIIKVTPDLGDKPMIQNVIVNRLKDKSATVRETALDLVAMKLGGEEINEVVERLFDVSVLVRKKAVKLVLVRIKEMIFEKDPLASPLLKRIFLIASRPDRQNDREEAKKIIREVFLPLNNLKIDLLINVVQTEITEAANQLIDTLNDQQNETLQNYLISQLGSESLIKVLMLLKLSAKGTSSKIRIANKMGDLMSFVCLDDDKVKETNAVLELISLVVSHMNVTKSDEMVMKRLSSTLLNMTYKTTNLTMLILLVKCFIGVELKKNEINTIGDFCVQYLKLALNDSVRQRALNVLAVIFKNVDLSATNSLKNYYLNSNKPVAVDLFNTILTLKSSTSAGLICQMNTIFSLLQQYPGLYIHYETIKNYFSIYITKTLSSGNEQLAISTLSLLFELFEAETTDDLSALQTTLAQTHTKELLPLLTSQSASVRFKALVLASSIIKKGLINPIQILSALIGLVTDKTQLTSTNAISLLRLLNEKSSSLIQCRFVEGSQMGFKLRGEERSLMRIPHPLSSVYLLFSLNQRKAVLTSLVQKFSDTVEEGVSEDGVYENLFLLEVVCLLQYTKSTEVMIVLQPLKKIAAVSLPDIRGSMKKRMKSQNVKTTSIAQLIVCVYATMVANFLGSYYNVNEEGNAENLTTSVSDLQDNQHPFVVAGFKYIDKIMSDFDALKAFWKYSRQVMDGEYENFTLQN
ncbi:hypothetical protein EIN_409680 [Entamoeba invadens IP1]|uniref:Sister chromatid cohesion protein n=1 Tax=Entamoeba invadens IP1 TaxID=370355 RepID=A0A0A1TWN6_ENTIV|nr:hypothetical protein EIN_409680 [Entamoeba invadens IP1]ELP85649.1 hypothetical protein EIN_409680 [Entamoeba invadens IP1]|eukprot:XP_004184995.1 hypothetical protein EIN_409680 [Entamoeba invadens IP1]